VLHFQRISTSFHNPMHTQMGTRSERSIDTIRSR
jgi:hypothetical protein